MKHRIVEFYRSDVNTNDRHGTPGCIEASHDGGPINLGVRDKLREQAGAESSATSGSQRKLLRPCF